MAKSVALKRKSGPKGVATLKIERGDVTVTFLAVPANPKTKSPGRPQASYVLPADTVPEHVKNNMSIKRWNIKLDEKEESIIAASPCDVTLDMRFSRFYSPLVDREDESKGYQPVMPQATPNQFGGVNYNFSAILDPLDDEWDGFRGWLTMDHGNLIEDDDGNMAFVLGRKGGDLIRQFLNATGVDVDELVIPFSSNVVPELDEAIRAAGNSPMTVMFGETGYIKFLGPSARKAPKAKAVKPVAKAKGKK